MIDKLTMCQNQDCLLFLMSFNNIEGLNKRDSNFKQGAKNR